MGLQAGQGAGVAALVTGMALRPAGDRTGDARRFAGIGLGMEAVQEGGDSPLLPLPGAGPGHIEAVAGSGTGGRTGGGHHRDGTEDLFPFIL